MLYLLVSSSNTFHVGYISKKSKTDMVKGLLEKDTKSNLYAGSRARLVNMIYFNFKLFHATVTGTQYTNFLTGICRSSNYMTKEK